MITKRRLNNFTCIMIYFQGIEGSAQLIEYLTLNRALEFWNSEQATSRLRKYDRVVLVVLAASPLQQWPYHYCPFSNAAPFLIS